MVSYTKCERDSVEAREIEVEGIAANHAYSVIGCFEVIAKNKETQQD